MSHEANFVYDTRTVRRAVVTGGAGFLGSHLCEHAAGQRGRGRLPRQLPHRVTCERRAPAGAPGIPVACAATSPTSCTCPARSTSSCTSPRRPRPSTTSSCPIETLKVGSLGTLHALGPGEGEGRPLRPGLDVGGLRRPAGAPAARELLGQRQPGRAARRLRRGQALRRGAHHGLPPQPTGSTPASSASSTRTGRGCGPTTAGPSRPSSRQALAGRAGDRCRRRLADPVDLLRRRTPCAASWPSPTAIIAGPVNIGNPDELSMLSASPEWSHRSWRAPTSPVRAHRPPGRRPARSAVPTPRWRASAWAGAPTVASAGRPGAHGRLVPPGSPTWPARG